MFLFYLFLANLTKISPEWCHILFILFYIFYSGIPSFIPGQLSFHGVSIVLYMVLVYSVFSVDEQNSLFEQFVFRWWNALNLMQIRNCIKK